MKRVGALVLTAATLATGVACDTVLVVGTNEATGASSALSCPASAPLRACASQTCVFSDIGAGQIGEETLAIDEDSIYFVSDYEAIGRMPRGGGPVETLVTGAKNLERMAIDDEYLYWTEFDGTVLKVPKKGGSKAVVVTLFGHPVPIALAGDDLYVAMTDSGEVAKIDKSSGAMTKLAGERAPIDLAVDREFVWWINQGDPGGQTGELVRAPLGDLTRREVVLSNLAEPLVLGVAEDSILWATYGKVSRLARAGGAPSTFDVALGEPKGVAEIEGIVYAAGEKGVHRVRVGDGSTLALDGRGITGIALACDGLYGVGWFEPLVFRFGPSP
ncbi:MAG: hypothetical protein U0414_40810 [Polyangiaceae bacterium]